MVRSRSSFELAGALASAASLTAEPEETPRPYQGVALVSFAAAVLETEGVKPSASSPTPGAAPPALAVNGERSRQDSARSRSLTPSPASDPPESLGRPPKLPDLSGVVSPVLRCEKILEWISDATGASEVFMSDASGLPIAGSIGGVDAEASMNVEARLAAAGLVASSVAQLAASLPGTGAPLFELAVGDGPFFQIIGFAANGGTYLVGLFRATPLTVRQAHAVRLACRHALGDVIGSPA